MWLYKSQLRFGKNNKSEERHLNGKRSLDRISLDRNCHFSVDRNFTNHLFEFFDTFHLIESLNNEFDQTPKKLSLDRKFY